MRKEDVLFFDIETTGLDPLKDQIQRISILDGNGNIAFDEQFLDQTLDKHIPKLQNIFDCADLVVSWSKDLLWSGDNIRCKLAFLERAGLSINAPTFDVTEKFSPIYDEVDKQRIDYKRQNLQRCSDYYDYPGNVLNSSLDNTYALHYCFYSVIRDLNWEILEDDVFKPTTATTVLVEPGVPAQIIEFDPHEISLQSLVGGDYETVFPFIESAALVCNDDRNEQDFEPNRAVYNEEGEAVEDVIYGTFLILDTEGHGLISLTPEKAERFAELYAGSEVFREEETTPYKNAYKVEMESAKNFAAFFEDDAGKDTVCHRMYTHQKKTGRSLIDDTRKEIKSMVRLLADSWQYGKDRGMSALAIAGMKQGIREKIALREKSLKAMTDAKPQYEKYVRQHNQPKPKGMKL